MGCRAGLLQPRAPLSGHLHGAPPIMRHLPLSCHLFLTMSGQGRGYSGGNDGSEGSGDIAQSSGSQDGAQGLAVSKSTSSSTRVIPGAPWGHSLQGQATLVGHTHMDWRLGRAQSGVVLPQQGGVHWGADS